MSHYTDGRRYSHISGAWILVDSWNQSEEIAYLRSELDKAKHYVDHPFCLLCGRQDPCMTEEEGRANGGPGAPCTFEKTPRQLHEENRRLRKELQDMKDEERAHTLTSD